MSANRWKCWSAALVITTPFMFLTASARAEEASHEAEAEASAGCLRADRAQAVLSCSICGGRTRAAGPRGEVSHGPVLSLENVPGQGAKARPGRTDRLVRYSEVECSAAVPAYRTLLSESPESHERCALRVRATECGLVQLNQAQQAERLEALLSEMQTFLRGSHPDESMRDCRELTARLVTRMVTGWHREAAGTDVRPGTLDEATMELASRSYDRVIDAFADLDTFEFPRWPEGADPTVVRMRYWQAELLWRRNAWAECGPAFDRVVELDPGGELAADSAYAAVLCYNNLYEEQSGAARRSTSDSFERQELTELERQLAGAYARYVCCIPESEDSVRVEYRRARVYYQANQWDEAAALFRRIAQTHSSDELAPYAANLYLDSLNVIARTDPERRGACRDELVEAVDRFLQDQELTRDEELRSQLSQLQCGIRWRQAEDLTEAERWGEAAELYMGLYRDHREQCQRLGSHDMCEVLYNASIAFEADLQIERAIEVRRELIRACGDESEYARDQGAASPWAKRAIYHIAGNHHAMLDFAEAALSYEDFVRRYPAEEEAPEALRDAIVFRLGLGEQERALEDSRLFERNYGRRYPAKTATVVFAVGQPFIERGEWRAAAAHYDGFLKRYGSSAGLDEVIQSWSKLGLARWSQRGEATPARSASVREDALAAFTKAVVFADQERTEGEGVRERLFRYRSLLMARGGSDSEVSSRLIRMITAIGQARFYLAEAERERFDAVEVTPLRVRPKALPSDVRAWATREEGRLGPLPSQGDGEGIAELQVRHWVEVELTPALTQREEALRRAERAYLKAVDEEVPEWEIAAAARIGEIYAAMAESIESLAGDSGLDRGSAQITTRRGLLMAQARPFRDQAAGAFFHCLRESVESRWFTSWTRRCEAGLRALDPDLLPENDGFWAEPVYLHSPLAIPEVVRGQGSL